jgi:hypothetical protein
MHKVSGVTVGQNRAHEEKHPLGLREANICSLRSRQKVAPSRLPLQFKSSFMIDSMDIIHAKVWKWVIIVVEVFHHLLPEGLM